VRTVDCFVATGRPTRAATYEAAVITPPNQESARGGLFLEVTLQTERLIAGLEHLVVHRTVGRVTDYAALSRRFMLEDKGATLGLVAFETGFVSACQLHAAAHDRVAGVGFVTIRARQLVGADRMRMGQSKLATLIQVTLETRFRVAPWVNDGPQLAAGLIVQTAGAMARFAPDVFTVSSFGHETSVRGIMKT
jgi:hypothetical protein